MAKAWGTLKMRDPYKKPKVEERAKEIHASRVIPLRFAFGGSELIKMLPLIWRLPQDGADIEGILRKRQRVMADIIEELMDINR